MILRHGAREPIDVDPVAPGRIEAARITWGLTLFIVVAASLGLITGLISSGSPVFAVDGLNKRVLLPLFYSVFAVLAVWPTSGKLARLNPAGPYPFWWKLLAFITFASTLGSLALPRQGLALLDLAQAVALFAGALLFTRFGMQGSSWTPRLAQQIIGVLIFGGFIQLLVMRSFQPFAALYVPSVALSLYIWFRGRNKPGSFLRLVLALLMVGLLVRLYTSSTIAHAFSVDALAQIGACAFLLLLASVSKQIRPLVCAVGALLGIVLFAQSNLLNVMLGGYDYSDVTIAERGYEARAVDLLVSENGASYFLGVGVGATVDLSSAPDVRTLAAAGRDIYAVDDVHLLTSYLYLKFGVLGPIWGLLLFFEIAHLGVWLFRRAKPDSWDFVLYLFVLSGGISALPAATNLFANPLLFLFLGILIGRRRASWRARTVDGVKEGLPDTSRLT